MAKKRHDNRPADPGHGTPREREESRKAERFIEVLRIVQLASAGVMFVGMTTSTLVCAGEFKQPWLVWAGGGVFVSGLGLFAVARPLARWWTGAAGNR